MPRTAEKKISPYRLRGISKLLFDRETLTGGDLARRMGRNYYVVRRWVKQDGLAPEDAGEIANVMQEWEAEIKEARIRLLELANKV